MRLSPRKMASVIVRTSAAVAISPLCAAPCMAQAQVVVDLSGQSTVSSAPSYGAGSGDGAVSVGLQIDPSVYFEDGDATTVSVRGTALIEQYTGREEPSTSVGLKANVQHRLSPRTLLNVNGSVSSTRSAVRDFLRQPLPAADILQSFDPALVEASGDRAGVAFGPSVLEPQLADPGFPDYLEAGNGGRTTRFRVGSAVSHQLSALDALSLGASATVSNSEDLGAADYKSSNFSASYTRKLSSRASLEAGVTGGRVDYDERDGDGGGDGTFFTPTLALSFRLSETVTSSLAAGVSVTKVEGPSGTTVTDTGLAGRVQLCRLHRGASLCANASRSVQPTSYSGLTTVTSAGITYGRAVGTNQNLSLAATYSHRSASLFPVAGVLDDARSLIAVSARYSREIGDRLNAFVSPGFARTWGGPTADRDNYQVSIGIRYRLGGLK